MIGDRQSKSKKIGALISRNGLTFDPGVSAHFSQIAFT